MENLKHDVKDEVIKLAAIFFDVDPDLYSQDDGVHARFDRYATNNKVMRFIGMCENNFDVVIADHRASTVFSVGGLIRALNDALDYKDAIELDPEVVREVKEIIATQFGKAEWEVLDECNLVDDLDSDSLDIVELTMSLEEKLDIRINDSDFEELAVTVENVIFFVHKELAKQKGIVFV